MSLPARRTEAAGAEHLILLQRDPLLAPLVGKLLSMLGAVAGDGQRQAIPFLLVVDLNDGRIVTRVSRPKEH